MDYKTIFATSLALGLAACQPDGGSGRPSDTDTDGPTDTTGEPSDDTTTTGDDDDDDDVVDDSSGGEEEDTAGETGPTEDICLLLNCEEDLHCAGCDDGRTICDTESFACVACDPRTGENNCDEDEECSDFGWCIPAGLDCPTADGLPAVDCEADEDCAACDADHQICDDGACVGCSPDNEDFCQSTEHCEQGECVDDCPETCSEDLDCGLCQTEGGDENHACNAHHCAECSETFPCPSDMVCNDQGVCVVPCGIPGQIPGTCEEDSDCEGCPEGAQSCNAPINGGHGECGAEAAGCSDLGDGVVVLPEPFDEVTNTCSDDADCADIGIQYNVGQLLRDITGVDAIDDANIFYPMSVCAAVSVGTDDHTLSCGVCAPCRVDDDCMNIDVDEVAGDAFGPLGAIATAILLDVLFGPQDHLIHMYCDPVTAEYGVCSPCPAIGNDCTADPPPPPDEPEPDCSHDVCTAGGPLDPSCGTCVAAVCAADGFCCSNEWDDICIGHVEDECAGSCGGGGDGGDCSHDQCEVGTPLSEFCNPCTSAICADDPFCCQTEWDHVCVGQVDTVCGGDCDDDDEGCTHSECELGGPLADGCSPCASDVCDDDAFCCNTDWDGLCVEMAQELCPDLCHPGGCGHDVCATGAPLEDGCSTCVSDVCDADEFCCETEWDGLCVDIAEDECGVDCDGSEPPPGDDCAHDPCIEGGALVDGCEDCVTDVCDDDSFCCTTGWDDICVQLADEHCGCFAACEHSECVEGDALEDDCNECVTAVCDDDAFCCTTAWDGTCVASAGTLCGCDNTCDHDICLQGDALDPGCDSCVADVCDDDPFCCDTSWDGACVALAETLCNCGADPCEHDECDIGGALEAECSPCAAEVCASDPFCCDSSWDSTCTDLADDLCGGCDTCEHDVCETGDALVDGCSDCVTDVCAADEFCCTVSWDGTCVGEAEEICGVIC